MDIVAAAWDRGNYSNTGDASPATHRTMKRVKPLWMLSGDEVHYLWSLKEPPGHEELAHLEVLAAMARDVVALGWGIDLAVGRGRLLSEDEADSLPGEPWHACDGGRNGELRTPVAGTLEALIERHSGFLRRIRSEGFVPPPPLTCYRKAAYRRTADHQPQPFAAFSLLKEDGSGFRSFDAARQALTVAGMLRHATKRAALQSGWDPAKVDSFVLGHAPPVETGKVVIPNTARFGYIPLPSLELRGSGAGRTVAAVRRAILLAFSEGCERELAWARRALSGQDLIDEDTGEVVALAALIPSSDPVIQSYTRSASIWATVTPVVLPGYDDPGHLRRRLGTGKGDDEQKRVLLRLQDRIDGLLRKALEQAGFARVMAAHAQLEWRKGGFLPGVEPADRYGVPDHLKHFPRYHLKITWRDQGGNPTQVQGPLCLGGGRFYGLGLLAPLPSSYTNCGP
jgi:CRISPR-associated protein Csb2